MDLSNKTTAELILIRDKCQAFINAQSRANIPEVGDAPKLEGTGALFGEQYHIDRYLSGKIRGPLIITMRKTALREGWEQLYAILDEKLDLNPKDDSEDVGKVKVDASSFMAMMNGD